MLGIIPIETVLDMLTPDDDDSEDGCLYVRDTLDHKRRSPHYPNLLDEIRADGMTVPININTLNGKPWLTDGHHRVAAALDLGMTHLVWSDVVLEVDARPFIPLRDVWGPYRPTT